VSGNGGNFLILDLTRVEGAQVLERIRIKRREGQQEEQVELFLYSFVEKAKNKIDEFKRLGTEEEPSEESVNEFFATNIFINGKRGTGKTSVLLTVYKEIKNDNDLLVLPIIDLSTNIHSVLVYILSYIKNEYFEQLRASSCCGEKLDDLFYKLELNFPVFLKCFCDENNETLCKYLCNKELEELLDKNELNYVFLLREFFKGFLKQLNKKKLVILIDDFDLVVDEKVLVRIIIELAIFLNLKEVIIVGAGDLENLLERLIRFFKKNIGKDKAEEVAKSYIEKLFSLRNVIDIPLVDIHYFRQNVRIKTHDTADEGEQFDDFLRRHYSLRRILDANPEAIYYILDQIPLRQLVQFLKAVYERVENLRAATQNNLIKLADYLVSPILISLFADDVFYGKLLKTDFNNEVEGIINQNGELEEARLKNGPSQDDIWFAFKSFNIFLRELFNKEPHIREAFIWDSINNFRDSFHRFFPLLKAYNHKLYSILYIWLSEMFIYLGPRLYPLIAITLSFLYGLPNVIIRLAPGNTDKLLTIRDYMEVIELSDAVAFDDSLNYLLASYRVWINYKRALNYLLFGKIYLGARGYWDLRAYFYKLLHNTYVAFYIEDNRDCESLRQSGTRGRHLLQLQNILRNLLYDIYSFEQEEENQEGQQPQRQQQVFIYCQRLMTLRNHYRDIFQNNFNFISDPERFDKRIHNIIRRSIEVTFRQNITNNNYKYLFSMYFPFLLLVTALENYDVRLPTILFQERFWGGRIDLGGMLNEVVEDLGRIDESLRNFFNQLIGRRQQEQTNQQNQNAGD